MPIANVANTDTFGVLLSTTDQLVVLGNQLAVGNVLGTNVLITSTTAANIANGALPTTGGTMTGDIVFTVGTRANTPTLQAYRETVLNVNQTTANYVCNLANTNNFDITLNNANTTITITNPAATGNLQAFTLILRQPGTAANVVNFQNTFRWSPDGALPVLCSGIVGRFDVIQGFTVSGGSVFVGTQSFANVG